MISGEASRARSGPEGASLRPLPLALLYAAFAVLGLVLYRGALHGAFIADDAVYVVQNPYVQALTRSNLVAILHPFGPALPFGGNYAPVHHLAHALERAVFGDAVLGYHVVNVLAHAACSTLLVALLVASRVPPVAAIAGGLLFAVHPANVEAVAWISQLKSTLALALAFGAVLAHRPRPALSAILFALALLAKAAAVFALPMAAALTWARRGEPGGGRRHALWLGAWAGVLLLFLAPQLGAFEATARAPGAGIEDSFERARTIAAIGARYLGMAASGLGLSAFHYPKPVRSSLDPLFLASIPLGTLLAWRALATLRRRREEAAWWIAAAAAFAPVSQIFPFMNPVADRYLYFILPGLLGGVLLAGLAMHARLARRLPAAARGLARGAAVAAVALAVSFGVRSAERAALWTDERTVLEDSAAHYPDGAWGRYHRAQELAESGDVTGAIEALRSAVDQGVDALVVVKDPAFVRFRGESAFRDAVFEMVGAWIEEREARGWSESWQLRSIAHAHLVREEYDEAVDALERALRAGGPGRRELLIDLEAVRRGAIRPIFATPEGGGDPDGDR